MLELRAQLKDGTDAAVERKAAARQIDSLSSGDGGRWDEVKSLLKDYKKEITSSLSQYKDMKEEKSRRHSPTPLSASNRLHPPAVMEFPVGSAGAASYNHGLAYTPSGYHPSTRPSYTPYSTHHY